MDSGYDGFQPIPGFTGYAINESGNLLRLKDGRLLNWHTTKANPKKRIVGGYKRRRIVLENGCKISLSRHRALCLTFKPVDKANELVVNHRNGIPGDDRLDNLEWATYSENTQHAYETGLHAQKVRAVLVWNLNTGEVVRYESIAKCIKALDWDQNKAHRRLRVDNLPRRFPDRLRIKYDDGQPWVELESEFVNSRRSQFVMARNVETGVIELHESVAGVSDEYGVSARAVMDHIERESFSPLAGCIFRKAAKNIVWPVHTPHQLELYRKRPTKTPRGVLVTWMDSGTEKLFHSVEEAAEGLNKGPLVVSRLCVSGKVHPRDNFKCAYIYPDREM